MEGRRVGHGGVPGHVFTSGGAAGRVGGQLADAEHVRAVNIVGGAVSTVSVRNDKRWIYIRKMARSNRAVNEMQ